MQCRRRRCLCAASISARSVGAFGFKRLFGIAPDEYDLFGRADTLQHIVQKAARTKRADFLGLFWDVFGYMRDLAVLRCDGLSAKEKKDGFGWIPYGSAAYHQVGPTSPTLCPSTPFGGPRQGETQRSAT